MHDDQRKAISLAVRATPQWTRYELACAAMMAERRIDEFSPRLAALRREYRLADRAVSDFYRRLQKSAKSAL